jgi:hypothetical protein
MAPDVSKERQKIVIRQSSVTYQENGMHNETVTDSNNDNKKLPDSGI